MIRSYGRKLETIRVMSLSDAMKRDTKKYHRPTSAVARKKPLIKQAKIKEKRRPQSSLP